MAADLPFDNAIGWAHLQLRGGWKNLLFTGGGIAIALAVLIFASTRINPDNTRRVLFGWINGLLGLQMALLLLFGCTTVSTAVRTDLTTNVIESHRLMPVHPFSAIAGYLIGASCQAVAIALTIFLVGAAILRPAGVDLMRWLIPNFILAVFALFLWVQVIFVGFMTRQSFRWFFVVGLAFMITQGAILSTLPGLTVLLSPIHGASIFRMRNRQTQLPWEYIVSMIAQAVFAAVFFLGAARRYRRADTHPLGIPLSLLLLAAWVAVSWVGIQYWDDFRPIMIMGWRENDRTMIISTLLSAMLLATVPLAAAAAADRHWRLHRDVHDLVLPARPLPPAAVALLAAALVVVLAYLGRQQLDAHQPFIQSIIIVTLFCLAMAYVLRIAYRIGKRIVVISGAWLVFSGAGPLLLDLIRYARLEDEDARLMGAISSASPIGSIFLAWDRRHPVNLTGGLIVQAVMVLLVMAAWYVPHWQRRRAAVPPPATPYSPLSPPSPTP
jgi:hypothetical protein